MKRSFFQAAVVSILLYGCTTWTLTKRLEKKLDGNYTRMLRAILNKSWRQHPTRHQLYGHLPPITKLSKLDEPDMQNIAGEAGTSSLVMYSYGPPYMAEQKQDDQLEHTYSSYVRIRNVALRTCQRRWTRRRSEERGSGISVLAARHDDDDTFPNDICPKVNVIARLEYERAFYKPTIQRFNHYPPRTPLYCVKGKDAVDHSILTRWFKKFRSGCKNLDDQINFHSVKVVDSEAVFQAIEANQASSTRRVSVELDTSQSSVVHHLHDPCKSIHSCRIVLHITKILHSLVIFIQPPT